VCERARLRSRSRGFRDGGKGSRKVDRMRSLFGTLCNLGKVVPPPLPFRDHIFFFAADKLHWIGEGSVSVFSCGRGRRVFSCGRGRRVFSCGRGRLDLTEHARLQRRGQHPRLAYQQNNQLTSRPTKTIRFRVQGVFSSLLFYSQA